MARSVVLGNNGLTVGLDENGLVHDFYYPYVGLENLTTSRLEPHHIGIWVDGQFAWLSDDSWERKVNFLDTALVSDISYRSDGLKIELHFEDFVDCHYDVFAREITVKNLDDNVRDFRIFFHQVFQISALGRADTVMYVPDGPYMLDYKGRSSILIYAESDDGTIFDQYAAGNAGIEGKAGTFKDAEDGELSNSPVEHGGVDSTIRVKLDLSSKEDRTVKYWLAVADTQGRLETLHDKFLGSGFNERKNATLRHWKDWLFIADEKLSGINQEYQPAIRKSLMTLSAHIDEHGGIIASCDSSIYNYGRDYYSYVWPRDGAYVIWPLIKLGYTKEPKAFFEFCRSILHEDGYLMHKYQPDRAIGSTWHPLVHGKRKELAIQEDETAITVFMLGEYLNHSGDKDFVESMYQDLVVPMSNFMSRFVDVETGLPHASYDLWEEKFLTNTYTTAITYKALRVASDLAGQFGEQIDADRWNAAADMLHSHAADFFHEDRKLLYKGFLLVDGERSIDETLDVSSFFAGWKYEYSSKHHLTDTLEAIERELLDKSPSGGSPRYEDDNYFKSDPAYRGNPWFVTTLWLAQYYACHDQKEKAKHYIDWTLQQTLSSGVLSEQINPESSAIVGVTPLIWSHAELINAVLDLKVKVESSNER